MLTERMSRIGQTLEWISGTIRVLTLDLIRQWLTLNSEPFEGSL